MSNNIWIAFKLCLSAVLVAAPIALVVSAPRAFGDPLFLGITAVLLFFAALPWVNFTAPNRSLGMVGIAFSLGIAFVAWQTASGATKFPRQCTGRRVAFCEFENMLFAMGGEYLAAFPFVLFAGVVLAGSIRMLRYFSRVR